MKKIAKYTHNVIKQVAIEICGAFYDHAAKNNEFYQAWPNEQRFLRANWPLFIEDARRSLAQMLTRSSLPEDVRDDIAAALILHQATPGNMPRQVAEQVSRRLTVPTEVSSLIH